MTDELNKWHKRWLKLAKEVSDWSKDPSTQVGAVIADGKELISLGFNGFPEGVEDDHRLDLREEKLELVIHAEMNAILRAKRYLTFNTLYTYPMMPCHKCSPIIIQSGITKIICPIYKGGKWEESFAKSRKLLKEAHIQLIEVEEDGII
jgi:dCMP deaminase